MFTGIVEETGTVVQPPPRLRVRCGEVLRDAVAGSSIAVDGVCLTAVEVGDGWFDAELSPETLSRSNLGDLRAGSLVNLERPLQLGARLDGHMVQGHVETTGTIETLRALPDGNWWFEVRVAAEVERYTVLKGSITIDGISLTIAALDGALASFAIIPYTYEHTNLRARRGGERVNLEPDMIAKYVEKLVRVLP